MPTIPPQLTAACYCAVLCLMVWKRTKAAWIWMIVGSSILGIAFLLYNEWLYAQWRIHWYQFDARLYASQLLQWWCELLAVAWLFLRTKALRDAPDECCLASAAVIVHLMLRYGYAMSYHPGWYGDPLLLQLGHAANLLMLTMIAVVVWKRRDCA